MTLGYSPEIAVGEKASDNEVSEPPSVAHLHYYIYLNINIQSYHFFMLFLSICFYYIHSCYVIMPLQIICLIICNSISFTYVLI